MTVPTVEAFKPILGDFIAYGLYPGQFGEYIIRRQRQLAIMMHCGPEKTVLGGGWHDRYNQEQIAGVDKLLTFFQEHTPEGWFVTHDDFTAWRRHSGLEGASETQKVIMSLITPRWWMEHRK